MKYSYSPEAKKFGRNECVQSVFIFLANYIIVLLMVLLFIWLNTLGQEGETFLSYITGNYSSLVYLLASIFILFFSIYFYYIFEDKSVLCNPKSIWLIFFMLDAAILICYFFGLLLNIYSRPIALLALLALMLVGGVTPSSSTSSLR